jgi:hypothetical protein
MNRGNDSVALEIGVIEREYALDGVYIYERHKSGVVNFDPWTL